MATTKQKSSSNGFVERGLFTIHATMRAVNGLTATHSGPLCHLQPQARIRARNHKQKEQAIAAAIKNSRSSDQMISSYESPEQIKRTGTASSLPVSHKTRLTGRHMRGPPREERTSGWACAARLSGVKGVAMHGRGGGDGQI